jgi:hypothetical protein
MCAVCYILLYMLKVELYLSMNGGKILFLLLSRQAYSEIYAGSRLLSLY